MTPSCTYYALLNYGGEIWVGLQLIITFTITFQHGSQLEPGSDQIIIMTMLPYYGKRKQVTYHVNLSYGCLCISPSVLFFHAKVYASTLILLRDMLGKTSWYSIDVSGNDRHILLFYKKFHFRHLLPFAKVGQYGLSCIGQTRLFLCWPIPWSEPGCQNLECN